MLERFIGSLCKDSVPQDAKATFQKNLVHVVSLIEGFSCNQAWPESSVSEIADLGLWYAYKSFPIMLKCKGFVIVTSLAGGKILNLFKLLLLQ